MIEHQLSLTFCHKILIALLVQMLFWWILLKLFGWRWLLMWVCVNPLHVALTFAENDPIYFYLIKIHCNLVFIIIFIPYHNILNTVIGVFGTLKKLLSKIHGRSQNFALSLVPDHLFVLAIYTFQLRVPNWLILIDMTLGVLLQVGELMSMLQVYTKPKHHMCIVFFYLDKYLVLEGHRVLRGGCHLNQLLKWYRLRRVRIVGVDYFLHRLFGLRNICYSIASMKLWLSPQLPAIQVTRLLFLIGCAPCLLGPLLLFVYY